MKISPRTFIGTLATSSFAALLLIGGAIMAHGAALTNIYPLAVAVNTSGSIYYADAGSQSVFSVNNGIKKLISHGPGKPRTPLYAISALATDAKGSILVADTGTCDVYRLGTDGVPVSLTGSRLNQPRGIVALQSGEIFVTDLGDKAIYRIDNGKPFPIALVDSPTGMALDKDGTLVVVSRGTNSLYRVTTNGQVTVLVKGRKIAFPHSVVAEKSGSYLVSDGYGGCIWRITPQGDATVWVRSDLFRSPEGLAIDSNGSVLVADPHARAILRVAQDGTVSTVSPSHE